MIFSKAAALELLDLNEQAYVLATTGHCVLPEGFSEPVPIRMPAEGRPVFLRGDPLDIWGYATSKDGRLYLVFRGTQITSGLDFAQEWAEDALSLPLQPIGGTKVHLGFYGAWKALERATLDAGNSLIPDGVSYEQIITGHSLGAAIATLCWAELGGDLMTFASPRVGDPAFGKTLWDGQTVRIVNNGDIVPNVPTDPPFRHGGQLFVAFGPGNWFDAKIAHSLESYRIGREETI